MRTVEVTDKAAFVAKADAIGAAIRVVRFMNVEPVQVGNTVSMVPGVEIRYFFPVGDEQWIYREIRRANQRGRVDLSDTLFTELEQRGGYELVHRSGSF
jgi:hypothetical protein